MSERARGGRPRVERNCGPRHIDSKKSKELSSMPNERINTDRTLMMIETMLIACHKSQSQFHRFCTSFATLWQELNQSEQYVAL